MKISIVGAGNVGASIAQYVAMKDLGDVLLLDIAEGLPQGKALDLTEAAPVLGYHSQLIGANDMSQLAQSDVIVVTAGFPRMPGMSRDDLLEKNAGVIRSVGGAIREHAPEAIIIMVTNPLDVMCQLMRDVTEKPHKEVFGQAGALDGARFAAFIAMELEISPDEVHALVLGGHGDSMVPLPRYTTVGGVPVTQLLPEEVIAQLVERTRKGGAEIVALLKKGSAFYAPAASTFKMVESVVRNKRRLIASSVYATGQYGIKDVYIGLPAVIGPMGVEGVIEVELTEEEADALRRSARHVAETVAKLGPQMTQMQ